MINTCETSSSFDTGIERVVPRAFADEVIRQNQLVRVPLQAVMENWQLGGLWARRRPLGALLLATWQATE